MAGPIPCCGTPRRYATHRGHRFVGLLAAQALAGRNSFSELESPDMSGVCLS